MADGVALLMKKLFGKKILSIAAFTMAMCFWFFDSSVHYFLYKEPEFEIFPGDFNELWMRLFIVSLMISFGIFADHFSNNIASKEKQLDVASIYNDMLHASLSILTNLLNQMQLFKLEAQRSQDFDREVLKLYVNAFNETSDLVERLSKLADITDMKIGQAITPYKILNLPGDSNPADNPLASESHQAR